jgi:hypothetical protein
MATIVTRAGKGSPLTNAEVDANFTNLNTAVVAAALSASWTGVTGKPATLAGYGITDAQPVDADLTAIAALAGTSGFLKKTAANTWALDTAAYLTGITSGQVTTALGFTPYNATNPSGYITASASITGNAATATALQTARTINGVSFNGTTNITVADATKLPLTGGSLTGSLSISGSLTASGDLNAGNVLRFARNYNVATATNVAIVTDGGSATALTTGNAYRVRLNVPSTGTQTGSMYLVHETAAATWTAKLVSRNGSSSNHPLLAISGTTMVVSHSHASTYTIRAYVERFSTQSTTGLAASYFGIDGVLTHDATAGTVSFGANALLHAGNYNSFSPTLTGTGASGTWGISVTGNAGTATALQTARTIGGVSFNGTANINLPGVNTAGNQSTTGNAATATTLQTARTINGTTFNGSANITTNNWGTARDINGTSINGSANYAIGRIYDTNYRRITNPGEAEYVTTTASVTGAIAITLPVGMNNTMVRMTIKVYDYTTNESFEIHCGGYNAASGETWANNPFAYIVGNPGVDRRFTVRFGYDSVALKAIVYIGELASTWIYPQVYVTDVQAGYIGNAVTWTTGWAIGFEATAFKNVTATITNSQVGYAVSTNTANSTVLRDGSGNFSAGTITAALSGNATTATTLQTARTINGVSFNGSANITVADSTKLPLAGGTMTGAIAFAAGQTWPTFNQSTTGNAATVTNGVYTTGNQTIAGVKTFSSPIVSTGTFNINGSAGNDQPTGLYVADLGATVGTTLNPTVTAAIMGQTSAHRSVGFSSDGTYIYGFRSHSTASTYTWSSRVKLADALATARTIGGVSFNGSANINLPGVNAAGNQNTTGSAATLTTARTLTIGNTGKTFNGSANVGWTLAEIGALSTGGGTITTSGSSSSLTVQDTGVNGANIRIVGDGATTPNKTIRAQGGNFQVINSGYTNFCISVTDGGNFTALGNVTAYSDERLKKDWAELPADFVERLAAVKSGTYTRIETKERQAGSSAQDWQDLLPEVVMAGTDDAKTLSLAYGNAALVSAIELAKRMVEQDARIRALEAMVEKLIGD